MALLMNIEYSGIPVEDAYHRIGSVLTYKTTEEMKDPGDSDFEVGVWKMRIDLEIRGARDKQPLPGRPSFTGDFDMSAGARNPILQGYAYLKTLPEFAEARDA